MRHQALVASVPNAFRPMPPCNHPPVVGNTLSYHQGERQRCPSCGGLQWFVGRQVATCARCETSLPIVITFTEHQPAEVSAAIKEY